ncbi:hypothetical protein GUJ93_ZPchr0010g7723 [Zizania palustris]|uniref:Uncharacterized protein n=1 Tax=Zizania palustris TaxID=103762 RepID=A0A8J5WDE2_ZIZPA|nr:hypothetical protein GUJ93_ZPchr0010g7723 [Zizania palustris]
MEIHEHVHLLGSSSGVKLRWCTPKATHPSSPTPSHLHCPPPHLRHPGRRDLGAPAVPLTRRLQQGSSRGRQRWGEGRSERHWGWIEASGSFRARARIRLGGVSRGRRQRSWYRLSDKVGAVGIPEMEDLLGSEIGKNDYDWLLTPPGTPRVPALEIAVKTPSSNILPKRSATRSSSTTRPSRLLVSQTENGHSTAATRPARTQDLQPQVGEPAMLLHQNSQFQLHVP